MAEHLVGGRYRIDRKLGSGTFGQIHLGIDVYTQEQVAIKFESRRSEYPMLYFESRLYCYLKGNCSGIPNVRWYGTVGQHYALVIDLLGENLEELLKRCGGTFSLKTVLMLADQMLKVIEYLHSKSFIHRDIKPDNFMIGRGRKANQVFLIDFGLAKKYRDTETHEHIHYRDGQYLIGTAKFASINSHDGIEITRRDDLESLGYVLVYLLKGSLPWQGPAGIESYNAYFRRIRNQKIATFPKDLCQGLPSEFKTYFLYCHGLRFDEAPNYAYLKKMFRKLFARQGYKYDYIFDWTCFQQPSLFSIPRHVQAARCTNANHSNHKCSVHHCTDSCKHERTTFGKIKDLFRALYYRNYTHKAHHPFAQTAH